MTNSKTIKTAAASRSNASLLLRPSTLLLAAVITLEVVGVRALPQGRSDLETIASVDGAAVSAPFVMKRAGSVEVRIVAQADIPSR